MRTLALIFLAGLVVLAVLLAAGRLAYARRIAALNEAISTAPAPVSRLATLPQPVRAFALRSGANPDALARGVRFLQAAEMQLKPGQAWQRIEARQASRPARRHSSGRPGSPGARFRSFRSSTPMQKGGDSWWFGCLGFCASSAPSAPTSIAARRCDTLPNCPGRRTRSWEIPKSPGARSTIPVPRPRCRARAGKPRSRSGSMRMAISSKPSPRTAPPPARMDARHCCRGGGLSATIAGSARGEFRQGPRSDMSIPRATAPISADRSPNIPSCPDVSRFTSACRSASLPA